MYKALYRKLRPKAFADIVGQEHIVKTLSNQLTHNRISHAYLFCGTRGTGKTSCAKVFAKALNCQSPIGIEPCGTCRPCNDAEAATSLDVIEIDAASNNGVDNIRDLKEEVRYPPIGRYKVYIIDEVHMLSTGAFNALLKTLEEPPLHVIFILATTDPHKIPATIHSRLMRFDFGRISPNIMQQTLAGYLAEEGINVEDDALAYVVALADGSMRDALSILDVCASMHYGQIIDLPKVLDITGSVDKAVFFTLIDALLDKDAKKCMDIIEELSEKGRDFGQFAQEMLMHLRNRLIEGIAKNDNKNDDVIGLIGEFSALAASMRHTANARLALEVMCIGFVSDHKLRKDNGNNNGSGSGNSNANNSNSSNNYNNNNNFSSGHKGENKTPKASQPAPPQKALPDDIRKAMQSWALFVKSFPANIAPFIAKAVPGYMEDEFLYIVCPDVFIESFLKGKTDIINDALKDAFGAVFSINIMAKNFYDERHKKKYNIPDDFNYNGQGIDNLRRIIDFDIEEL